MSWLEEVQDRTRAVMTRSVEAEEWETRRKMVEALVKIATVACPRVQGQCAEGDHECVGCIARRALS